MLDYLCRVLVWSALLVLPVPLRVLSHHGAVQRECLGSPLFYLLSRQKPSLSKPLGFFFLAFFLPVCSHMLACKKEQACYFHYPYKAGKVSIADQFLLQLSKSSAPLLSGEYPLNDTEYWSENYIYTRPKPYKGSRKEQSVSWVIRCDLVLFFKCPLDLFWDITDWDREPYPLSVIHSLWQAERKGAAVGGFCPWV